MLGGPGDRGAPLRRVGDVLGAAVIGLDPAKRRGSAPARCAGRAPRPPAPARRRSGPRRNRSRPAPRAWCRAAAGRRRQRRDRRRVVGAHDDRARRAPAAPAGRSWPGRSPRCATRMSRMPARRPAPRPPTPSGSRWPQAPPRSIWARAMSADLWVLAWARRRTPMASSSAAMRARLRSKASRSTISAGVWMSLDPIARKPPGRRIRPRPRLSPCPSRAFPRPARTAMIRCRFALANHIL